MSEQEQFEAWWNGDRPTDFTEYGASQWTKAHAYSAWLARASRPREAGMYVQQVPFKGCACAGCLAGDPLHHPYLCETCYAKVVPAPKWEAT